MLDRKTIYMEEGESLVQPESPPPPIPGAGGTDTLGRVPTRLPQRRVTNANTRVPNAGKPIATIWNAVWDEWYKKTGKVILYQYSEA